MGNIWMALIPTIFVFVVSAGAIIFQSICKPNYYSFKIIAFVFMTIAMFVFAIPYFKDMAEGKTTVIVAEYDGFQRNSKIGTRKVIFIEDGRRYELFIPGYAGDIGRLQEGKIYKIEYFNNSSLIKSYSLIE